MLNVKQKTTQRLFSLTAGLVFFSVVSILLLTIISYSYLPSVSFAENPLLEQVEGAIFDKSDSSVSDEVVLTLLDRYTDYAMSSFEVMQIMLLILVLTLVLTLILLGAQMHLWTQDRKKLTQWKKAGFLCENLEFLPANRIKLNNIELELNKTQIENLKKLAMSRQEGKTLHSLDVGEHGVQSIKRLREELGARFLEKTLIKVRKREGYWLEVESDNIHVS